MPARPAHSPTSFPARSLSVDDRARCLRGFLHFSGKTIHSSVSNVAVRLPVGEARPELPYVALSTLGSRLEDLDYTEGGARFVRTPRQVKDLITGADSGVTWDVSQLSPEDLDDLSPSGAFAQAVGAAHADLPDIVPVLLRQIIVRHAGGDVSLTPIGAMGLNRVLLDRLQAERARRAALDPKHDRPFWGRAENILGGKKPQNIGLICAVNGGPAAAGFAWHFKAPAAPSFSMQRRLATLFQSFRHPLSAEQAKALNQALQGLTAGEQRRAREHAVAVIAGLTQSVREAAGGWKTRFLEQLALDFEVASSVGLLERLLDGDLPDRHREPWRLVAHRLDNNRIYAGWLLPVPPSGWCREAAAEMVRGWLRQLQVPLTPAHETFLIGQTAKGIA